MKKLLILFLSAVLLLSGCGGGGGASPTETKKPEVSIAATTWSVYCFTTAVTAGVSGITVTPVVNEPVGCLHDYTLTVGNMKALEGADVIVMNGAGLEDFMDDALGQTKAQVVDCAQGVTLLQDETGADDPHIWMDPQRAIQMMDNIAAKLTTLYPEQGDIFTKNSAAAAQEIRAWLEDPGQEKLAAPQLANLITFHDGFRYFADAFGLNLLKSIEEEEGSEASAKEINEIIALTREQDVRALFTEENGPQATAEAIARETGLPVYQLSMIMSGTGEGITPYLDGIKANYKTLLDALTVAGS